jgi:hypothetical protein
MGAWMGARQAPTASANRRACLFSQHHPPLPEVKKAARALNTCPVGRSRRLRHYYPLLFTIDRSTGSGLYLWCGWLFTLRHCLRLLLHLRHQLLGWMALVLYLKLGNWKLKPPTLYIRALLLTGPLVKEYRRKPGYYMGVAISKQQVDEDSHNPP